MIDPVGVGREWGRTFPDIWLPDSDIEERVIADFWERSKHAIDRPTWPWRRTLRITWYATLIAMLGFIIYGQFIDSYLSGGGSLASAASSDLNIVGWSLGTLVLLLVIVGSLRLMLFTFSGIPAIKQARTTWTNHASEAAVTMIGTRRKLLPRRHPAPSPQPFGITPAAAPALVREWMRHLGERDAEILDGSAP